MTETLRQTPLHKGHLAAKARMVDFAGWDMPVLYTGILEEARAVRKAAGLFDISHMGRIRVSGHDATAFLQSVTSNSVAALAPTFAQYSLLTNPTGGVIDDIIVYREGSESYLVVINASNTSKDIDWLRSRLPASVTLVDETLQTAMIAVQGPLAPQIVSDLANSPELLSLKRFQYAYGGIAGATATFCRTGYTGEDGFELIVPAAAALDVLSLLTAHQVTLCGLGARDALRIEAGYPLYGHEIDDTTSPVEAGLMWAVSLDKGEFVGREAIRQVKAAGPKRRLVGLKCSDRIVPRQGYTIYKGDLVVGEVTSGVFSPTVEHGIAMAYLETNATQTGNRVEIAIRDKRIPAIVTPKKSLIAG